MNKIILSAITLTFGLILAGCGASKGTWIHPKLANTNPTKMNIELIKADGYCDQVSYGSVPMPNISIPSSTNQRTSGDFTAFDTYGNTYYGSYSGRTYSGGGFSDGLIRGAAFGSIISSNVARANVWKSCMYRLGWVEGSMYGPSEYQNRMRLIAAEVKNDKRYVRLNLNTEEKKQWFNNLCQQLWSKKITKSTYLKEGLKRYPSKEYEFNFVADRLISS